VLNKNAKRVASILLLTSTPLLARAQEPDTSNTAVEQRLKIVERQLEIQTEEAANKAKDAPVLTAGEKGFSLKSANGDYELKLRALAQIDGRFFIDDQNAFKDQFLLRRLRPTFEGSLGKFVGFRLTPEFAASATNSGDGLGASIVDAYIDLKFAPWASIRGGKQKGPIGLERLQSGGNLDFVERGYPPSWCPTATSASRCMASCSTAR